MRQLAISKDVLSKVIARSLSKANISVTYACNYRCKTCNIWRSYVENPDLRHEELTLDDYDQIFKENGDLIWVSLTGGEPFLRTDFAEILVSAMTNLKKMVMVNVATNGSMPEHVEKCIRETLDVARPGTYVFIEVSLDGTEPVHDEIRGVKFAYGRALETFTRLRQLKTETGSEFLNVKFEYTMSKFNAGMLKATMEELADSGVPVSLNDFVVTFAHNSFFYKNFQTEVVPETEDMLHEVSWFFKQYPKRSLFDRVSMSYLKASLKYFSGGWRPPCVAGAYSCFLDPFGNVYPCITMNYLLGNLKRDGFNLREMLANGRSTTFKERIRPSCSTCWTSCEAYQTIIFNFPWFLKDLL